MNRRKSVQLATIEQNRRIEEASTAQRADEDMVKAEVAQNRRKSIAAMQKEQNERITAAALANKESAEIEKEARRSSIILATKLADEEQARRVAEYEAKKVRTRGASSPKDHHHPT